MEKYIPLSEEMKRKLLDRHPAHKDPESHDEEDYCFGNKRCPAGYEWLVRERKGDIEFLQCSARGHLGVRMVRSNKIEVSDMS